MITFIQQRSVQFIKTDSKAIYSAAKELYSISIHISIQKIFPFK